MIIDGSIIQFLFYARETSPFNIKQYTVVDVSFATTPTRAPTETVVKTYKARLESSPTTEFGVFGAKELVSFRMGEAVSVIVKEFTTDPEFLEQLKRVKNMK